MGNQHVHEPSNGVTVNVSGKSKKLKLFKHKKGSKKRNSKFFLKYNASNENMIEDISSLDSRRLIFVSLIGLFESWKKCPSFLLYSSMFILPLKRKWIYNLKKYRNEIMSNFADNPLFYSNNSDFIKLLKWKDSQNLIFWILDYDKNCLFWQSLSYKLTSKYQYEAINLDEKWWQNEYNKNEENISRFDASSDEIINQLFSVKCSISIKYKVIQEIIFQSNPESLNPIISYGEHNKNQSMSKITMVKVDSIERMDTLSSIITSNSDYQNDDDGWFIAVDYDD